MFPAMFRVCDERLRSGTRLNWQTGTGVGSDEIQARWVQWFGSDSRLDAFDWLGYINLGSDVRVAPV
jgi:hypothetical protein